MIPLNEYPKEELETLYRSLVYRMNYINLDQLGRQEYNRSSKWCERIKEAISDQDFKEATTI